ncbi:MAG: tetratricopeptide repeat protein [Armatimonadota bacterium]
MSASDRELGLAALRRGDPRAAVEHLRRAVEAVPVDAGAWGYLGVAYGHLGNSEAALRCLHHAATLAPGSAAMHYNLGLALERAGRPEEAAGRLRQAVMLDRTHAAAAEALRRLESRAGSRPVQEASRVSAPAVTPPSAPAAPAAPRVAQAVAPPVARPSRPPLTGAARLGLLAGIAVGVAVVAIFGSAGWIYLRERLRTVASQAGSFNPTAAPPAPARDPVSIEVPSTGLHELTPKPSGGGLQVCDPVPQGANAETAAFGAGCGRWLQFTAGAHPQLGRTPLWTSSYSICRTLKRTHLRITPREAPYLATGLGVSHAAVGEIRGSGSRCVLTYRVLEVPSGKAVGAPIRLSGSRAQVLAQLPEAARALVRRAGAVPQPGPTHVQESASDLTFLGGLPWVPVESIGAAATERLREVSQRGVLGAFYFLMNRAVVEDYNSLFEIQDALKPDDIHPLVLAQYAQTLGGTGAGLDPRFTRAIHRGVALNPSNYLLRVAVSGAYQQEKKFASSIKEAQEAVRCNMESPTAWAILGDRYANWADSIRRGRTVDQMQPDELAACQKLYPFWLEADFRSAELDPRNLTSGLGLSCSAAFCGEEELADEAFSRILRQFPEQASVYHWGLQLYHPKWLGNEKKAEKLARAAASPSARSQHWSSADRIEVALYTHLVGYPQLAQQIVRNPVERNEYRQLVDRQSHMMVQLGRR